MSVNDIDFSNISTGWVLKLSKENLINLLTHRNLKTEGTLIKLRNILFKYLKGEATSDLFINSENTP